MKTFIHWTGWLNILSGLFMLAFWYLYALLLPYGKLTNTLSLLVLNKNWTFVNLFGVFGSMAGILGLIGLFVTMQDELSRWAVAGFLIALAGSVLMFSALLRDILMWPILAGHDASLLDFAGPIYASKTFLPFFIFSGVLYTAGSVMFGLSIAGHEQYPLLAGHLFAWGALLFGIGPMFGGLQVYIRSVGITALSIGLIWLGVIMRKM